MVGGVITKRYFGAYKKFLSYALLSYCEKGLIFCFPLLFLWLTKSQSGYNQVEYVFAVSAMLALFLDGGLRIYVLYAYRQGQESMEVVQRLFNCLRVMIKCYLLAALLIWVALWLASSAYLHEFSNVAARSLFLVMAAFLAVLYRIKDDPPRVFYYTIPVYLVGLSLLWLLANAQESQAITLAIAVPHLVSLFVVMASGRRAGEQRFSEVKAGLMSSLAYAWPVLLSVALAMLIANFGKIYAYTHLSEQQMFSLSFVQRLALIVQLAHISITGYLAKKLFVSESLSYHCRTFALYAAALMMACILSFISIYVLDYLSVPVPVGISGLFLVVMLYVVCWCIAAYLEIYLNRANRNGNILIGTVLSMCVYCSVLYLFDSDVLMAFAVSMAASSMFYMLFISLSLVWMKNKK